MSDELEEERLFSQGTESIDHHCESGESFHVLLPSFFRLAVVELDKLDNCMPEAESVRHRRDEEFRKTLDAGSGEGSEGAVMRKGAHGKAGCLCEFIRRGGEV